MGCTRSIALAIALTLVAVAARAQMTAPSDIVKISAALSGDKLVAGSKFKLAVTANVKREIHVNAESPDSIPPRLAIAAVPGVKFGKAQFPTPIMKKFTFSEKPVPVYEGSFKIIVPGEVAKNAKASSRTIKIALTYQACDNVSCYPPGEGATQVTTSVSATGTAKSSDAAQFCETDVSPPPADSGLTGRLLNTLKGSSPIVAALISFLLGIGLCLTPCVYPMIPVTVGFFASQTQGKRRKTLTLALAYVFGIAITYSALGFAAASFGMVVGSLLQNPVIIGLITVVFLALAASMFGLFELQPPAFILNRSGGRSGIPGALMMGLMLGLVASPCIGPPVAGVALWVTQIKQPVLGFWIFFSMALGLGLPFLAIAMCSGGICKTPQAGPWMVNVKKLSGLALLGAGLYFGRLLLPEPAQLYVMPAFLLGAAIYLSAFRSALTLGRASIFARPALGIALIIAGLWSFPMTQPAQHIVWQPYAPQALEQASKDGRPVIIDFTASWCQMCKELENHTFTAPKVIQASCPFVRLRADMTRDSARTNALAKRFGVKGLPTVVFVDSQGKEVRKLRVIGVVSAKDFLGRLTAVK